MKLTIIALITMWISGSAGFVVGGVLGYEKGRRNADMPVE